MSVDIDTFISEEEERLKNFEELSLKQKFDAAFAMEKLKREKENAAKKIVE